MTFNTVTPWSLAYHGRSRAQMGDVQTCMLPSLAGYKTIDKWTMTRPDHYFFSTIIGLPVVFHTSYYLTGILTLKLSSGNITEVQIRQTALAASQSQLSTVSYLTQAFDVCKHLAQQFRFIIGKNRWRSFLNV